MNRRAFVSGLAVAALAGVAPLPAAADGKRVALVIGNGAYRSVPALTNPPTDAGDIAHAVPPVPDPPARGAAVAVSHVQVEIAS